MNFRALNFQYIPEMSAKFRWKILFRFKIIKCWMSVTKYLRYQHGITFCSLWSGIDVCWRSRNNVNNNKMVFSADDHVLIKLLRQEKGYDTEEVYLNIFHQAVDTVRIKQMVA